MLIYPAPMEGVFSREFVKTVNALNLAPRWMTPFMRVSSALPRKKIVKSFLSPYLASGKPVAGQVLGDKPELISQLALLMADAGVSEVNLNAACPSRRVVNHSGGGDLLRHPDLICRIICAMRAMLPDDIVVSVKMRSGFESFEPELYRRISDTPVNRVYLHYRTVKEGYAAVPDRGKRFEEARKLLRDDIALIVNGDISSAAEARHLAASIPASGVMIGRPWLHNPGLLCEIAGETAPYSDAEEARERFFDELVSHGVNGGNKIELAKLIFGSIRRCKQNDCAKM